MIERFPGGEYAKYARWLLTRDLDYYFYRRSLSEDRQKTIVAWLEYPVKHTEGPRNMLRRDALRLSSRILFGKGDKTEGVKRLRALVDEFPFYPGRPSLVRQLERLAEEANWKKYEEDLQRIGTMLRRGQSVPVRKRVEHTLWRAQKAAKKGGDKKDLMLVQEMLRESPDAFALLKEILTSAEVPTRMRGTALYQIGISPIPEKGELIVEYTKPGQPAKLRRIAVRCLEFLDRGLAISTLRQMLQNERDMDRRLRAKCDLVLTQLQERK